MYTFSSAFLFERYARASCALEDSRSQTIGCPRPPESSPPQVTERVLAGDMVVVSPDVGGVARARAFAKKLSDAPLAIVDKRRSAHNVSEVMNLIGDVKGKVAVLVDDMIDTAGTITNAGKVLHQEGAKAVYACATHAVFSPPARERLSSGARSTMLCWRCVMCLC